MKTNVIKVRFGDLNSVITSSVFQYDKGQVLNFIDEFEDGTEIQFANKLMDIAINREIIDNKVEIPNILLETAQDVLAWIQIVKEDSETTVKCARIPIQPRVKPSDYIEQEDEQTFRESIQQVIDNARDTIQSIRDDIEEGRLKGDKGDSPTKGVDYWTSSDKSEIVADVESYINPLIEELNQDILDLTTEVDNKADSDEISRIDNRLDTLDSETLDIYEKLEAKPSSDEVNGAISGAKLVLQNYADNKTSYQSIAERLYNNTTTLSDSQKLKIENWLGLSENYLTTYNTTPYVVEGQYNPTHKKYVDDKIAQLESSIKAYIDSLISGN